MELRKETRESKDSRSEKRDKNGEKCARERRTRSGVERTEGKIFKRKRQRLGNVKLPPPPPDPRGKRFAERVMSYDKSGPSTNYNSPGIEEAFDHLDRLHAMMEDIIVMRETSWKLFRRVRHLEKLRVLKQSSGELERLVSRGHELVLPEEDVGFAESLLGAMLSSSFELSNPSRGPASPLIPGRVTRSRSSAIDHRRVSCPVSIDNRLRAQNRAIPRASDIMKKRPSLGLATPKVSKWTRVKAAFKWEKAACTNNDFAPEPEVSIIYLKIPENPTSSSQVSGPPTPAGTISSSSSIDDVFHRPQRTSSNQSSRITRRDESSDPSRRSRSLDGDASVPMNFVYSSRPSRSKDNSCIHGKVLDSRIPKTPWGKVKDMMQLRRDSLGRQPVRNISRNDDAHSTSSLESSDILRSETDGRSSKVSMSEDSTGNTRNILKTISSNAANDFADLASRRLTPTLTITVPSSEELRCISSPESVTPSPPSPRLSNESGNETPKETRTGQVSPASSSSGVLRYGLGRSRTYQGAPPAPAKAGDYKRQQSLKGESLGSSPKMQRRDSKWNKVKRAFLTSATSVPTSPSRISSYFFDDGDATGGSYSASASAEDLENDSAMSPGVQAEIQKNYRLLHDKLGTEFYRKLAEWERLKSTNSSNREASRSTPRDRDTENLRLMGEERLTPEFKKKLEEWNRMNKGDNRGGNSGESRSVNRRRITDWQLWRSASKADSKSDSPRLSEDFMKKMEQWKRMKSAMSRRETEAEVDSHPLDKRLKDEEDNEEDENEEKDVEEEEEAKERGREARRSEKRRKAWKSLDDEEFKPLERVLDAMEMDRQTRLSKLQRIVGSQPQRTQQVLIHTSTGLYRFEGISRKFTRKLYEWEKSQGISPELSTFRLLDPLRYGVGTQRTRAQAVDHATGDGAPRKIVHRSKSVGCADIDSLRKKPDHEKVTIRRLCSLSLNDIDHIDARSCLFVSSIATIPDEEDTSEDLALEDSEPEHEPEAVIVDIEDVIEETASPLRKYQPHQTPVYSVAGSETTSIAIPLGTVTARHEPSPVILIEPGEVHHLRARACLKTEIKDEEKPRDEPQTNSEPIVIPRPTSLPIERQNRQRSIAAAAASPTSEQDTSDTEDDNPPTKEQDKDGELQIGCINDPAMKSEGTSDSEEAWRMAPLPHADYEPVNSDTMEKISNEEDETMEESVITVCRNVKHSKKILKTRRLTDTQVGYDWRSLAQPATSTPIDSPQEAEQSNKESRLPELSDEFESNPNIERILINEETLNKIVVPTAPSSATMSIDDRSVSSNDEPTKKERREAASVFVKTKRMVFSPFRRDSKNKSAMGIGPESPNTDQSKDIRDPIKSTDVTDPESPISNAIEMNHQGSSPEPKFPPLPISPIFARKEYKIPSASSAGRDKSPSIRMMIRRYNEKLEGTESGASAISTIGTNSTTSSCSSSPSWTTPSTERKFSTRPDRYDVAKKSLSTNKNCRESCNHPNPFLSKSSSVDFNAEKSSPENRQEIGAVQMRFSSSSSAPRDLVQFRPCEKSEASPSVRAMKIRRAKENFLSMGKTSVVEDSEAQKNRQETTSDEKQKNVDEMSSSSKMDIVKSASVGMINVDAGAYERLQNVAHVNTDQHSDSLPRSTESIKNQMKKESTSRFSAFASKLKKTRLGRGKEHSGMSTISKLCRQSLLVDIANENRAGKNCGPSSSRSSDTRRVNDDGHPKNDEKTKD